MDQSQWPLDSFEESSGADCGHDDTYNTFVATNESIAHTADSDRSCDQDSQLWHVVAPPADDDPRTSPESSTFAGRPDIDAAIVLALRSVDVTHSTFPMLGH